VPAGKVPVLQQPIHGVLHRAHPHKSVHTAGDQHQQQTDGHRHQKRHADHHSRKQGHRRQNAERRTNAVGPVILRRKGGTALPHQRCHAVLGLDGLLFQKLIFPHRRAALHKQHNGHSHQHQQRDHPQAARQIVVQTKQPELTHRTQRQQRNGADDAERRRQRHLRRVDLCLGQVIFRLRQRHPGQERGRLCRGRLRVVLRVF